jgi:hypothetical protein
VSNALGTTIESCGPLDVAERLYRPQVIRWASRITKAGARRHSTIPAARPFPQHGALDLPGRPVPIATRGHTSGDTSVAETRFFDRGGSDRVGRRRVWSRRKGWQRSFLPSINAPMAAIRSLTLSKLPRRMACGHRTSSPAKLERAHCRKATAGGHAAPLGTAAARSAGREGADERP